MLSRTIVRLSLAVVAVASLPPLVLAQSLRGSHSSIERMYREARREKLHFYETSRGVRKAAKAGTLVRLDSDANYSVHGVAYPFVQPATLTFVERLAKQYRAACDEQLVVTSATRPATRQPSNSTRHSVHPTGMAVDLRKPDGDCLRWLRSTLLDLEDADLLEVTEEFGPPHFHVAVFPAPYARYAAARMRAERALAVAEDGEER